MFSLLTQKFIVYLRCPKTFFALKTAFYMTAPEIDAIRSESDNSIVYLNAIFLMSCYKPPTFCYSLK